ncbi:hypothetical protein MASR2M15_06480 [Anaerolineales bacterium]
MEVKLQLAASKSSRWARMVSDILSPPVVWGFLMILIAFSVAPDLSHALIWSGIYIALVCILPVIYIAIMVYRGKITDIHMPYRRERYLPFIVTLIASLVAWAILAAIEAPAALPYIASFSIVQIAVMGLITIFWQISMHTMTITGAAIALGVSFGLIYTLLAIPVILLVGAARLSLKRHTPAQVYAGVFVGCLVPLIILLIS